MSNSGPNLQECRKKGLLEKEISFLSLSPPFFFVSRADAGENTREIETWDCSKNKKIRAKPDSRIQCLWRLLLMGSCHRLKFLETCGAACSRRSDFPRFSPRFARVGFTSLLTYHERLEQATCGAFEDFCFLKQSKEKQKKEKNLPNLFTNQSRLAWPTRLLNLSSDVDVFEVIDWPTYHVFLQRRFANRNMRVYSWFSTRKRCSQKNKCHHYHWKKNHIIT